MVNLDENYWKNFKQEINQSDNQQSIKSKLGNFVNKTADIVNRVHKPFLPLENTVTIGTAPLIAGAGNVLLSGNPLKNTKQKFKEGTDFYKQQLSEAREEYPIETFLGEVGGMFAPGSLVAKGAKVLPLLKNISKLKPTTKAIAEGAGIGGSYGFGEGAFNQKDKVVDIKKGVKEGLENAAFGGAIGFGLNKVGNKIKDVLLKDKSETAKLKDLLRSNNIPIEAYTILENADKDLLSKIQKKDLGNAFKSYQENFDKTLKSFKDKIKKTAENTYSTIKDEKILLDNVSADNITKNIDNYQPYESFMDKESKQKITETLDSIKKFLTENKGREISLDRWQSVRQELFELANNTMDKDGKPIREKGGKTLENLYTKARDVLFNLQTINPKIQSATKEYASMMEALDYLKQVFGKNFEDKDVGLKILRELSEKRTSDASSAVDKALEKVKDIPGLNNIMKEISDNSKLMQLSYIFKPEKTKAFEEGIKKATSNPLSFIVKAMPSIDNPINKYQRLAKAIQEGTFNASKLSEPYRLARYDVFRGIVEKFYNTPKEMKNKFSKYAKPSLRNVLVNPITRKKVFNLEEE